MKKLITYTLILWMLLCISTNSAAYDDIKIFLNGNRVYADQAPVIIDGRTLIPIRAVAEAMGCNVNWNDNTQTVSISNSEIIVGLQIDHSVMTVTSDSETYEKIELDVPPKLINNRTCLPLRAVAEVFGANVSWEDSTQSIDILYNRQGSSKPTLESEPPQPPQVYPESGDNDSSLKLEDKCKQIIDEVIKPGMTDLEKEKAIHDYLVKNARYDIDNFKNNTIPDISFTPYGLLIEGTGVCQAYAETTKLLLEMVGIECMIISGEGDGIGGWGGHAWNIVKIDGKYYHLDVTWDDPVPDSGDNVRYNYFNVSDRSMKGDHRWDNANDYPACNDDMDLDAELANAGRDSASDNINSGAMTQHAGLDISGVSSSWFNSLPTDSLVTGTPLQDLNSEYIIVVFGRIICGNTMAYIPRANEIINSLKLDDSVSIVFYDVDLLDDVKDYAESENLNNVTVYTGGEQKMWDLIWSTDAGDTIVFPTVVYVRNGKAVNATIDFQNSGAIKKAILYLVNN